MYKRNNTWERSSNVLCGSPVFYWLVHPPPSRTESTNFMCHQTSAFVYVMELYAITCFHGRPSGLLFYGSAVPRVNNAPLTAWHCRRTSENNQYKGCGFHPDIMSHIWKWIFFTLTLHHIHWGPFYNYICSTVHIILHWSLLHILTPCCRAVIMEITQTFCYSEFWRSASCSFGSMCAAPNNKSPCCWIWHWGFCPWVSGNFRRMFWAWLFLCMGPYYALF